MNDLISIGITGFRVDASKHMWPEDLKLIYNQLNDLPEGGRPTIYQEVIDQGGLFLFIKCDFILLFDLV